MVKIKRRMRIKRVKTNNKVGTNYFFNFSRSKNNLTLKFTVILIKKIVFLPTFSTFSISLIIIKNQFYRINCNFTIIYAQIEHDRLLSQFSIRI